MIYFGGFINTRYDATDKVVEYKNQKWTLLGNLAGLRERLSSIKMGNKIYLLGGWEVWASDYYDIDYYYESNYRDM